MPTIKYPKNPNTHTAFVEHDNGTQNLALMIAPQDISTLELPSNPNSTKGYVTIDGKKQRVVLTADISGNGGGGSSLPDQTGHSGEFLTTDGTDASWGAVSEVPSTTGATEGDVLTVDSNGDPAWTTPSGGGLPDQTGQSGKFLTTDGTDASWSDTPLVNQKPTLDRSIIVQDGYPNRAGNLSIAIGGNTQLSSSSSFVRIGSGNAATGGSHSVVIGCAAGNEGTEVKTHSCVIIGDSASCIYGYTSPNAIAIGRAAQVGGNAAIAIGYLASAEAAGAIQLGSQGGNQASNPDANTFKVANATGNFEMMNANGNLPADRLASTTGLTDGNYRLRLVMASGVPTLEWVAE